MLIPSSALVAPELSRQVSDMRIREKKKFNSEGGVQERTKERMRAEKYKKGKCKKGQN